MKLDFKIRWSIIVSCLCCSVLIACFVNAPTWVISSLTVSWFFIVLFWMNTEKKEMKPRRTWMEIDVDKIEYNVTQILETVEDQTVIWVLKGDAAGMGAFNFAKRLNQMNQFHFAVATLSEAISLRQQRIKGEILVLGYTPCSQANLLHQYKITQTITSVEHAKEFQYKNVAVHIKIDTGMHRLGISYENIEEIVSVYQLEGLTITGIYSHLFCSDELSYEREELTRLQITRFELVLQYLKSKSIQTGMTHVLSSYGLLNYPEYKFDAVRVGFQMHGCLSSNLYQVRYPIPSKKVMSMYSTVAQVKEVKENEYIGYGCNYYTSKPIKIAVVTVGYGDGYPRVLSNKGYVLIHNQKANIIGNICMDQMMIDVTDINDVYANDIVTLFSSDIYIEELADLANTIANDIYVGFTKRVDRIYLNQR